MANNNPIVRTMKRGGKYRRCYFIQPYLSVSGPSCTDVMRCVFMEL